MIQHPFQQRNLRPHSRPANRLRAPSVLLRLKLAARYTHEKEGRNAAPPLTGLA